MKKILERYLPTVFIIIAALFCSACGSGTENDNRENLSQSGTLSPVEKETDSEVTDLTEGNLPIVRIDYADNPYDVFNDFAYEFFLQNLSDENPVLSPVSAYLALSMVGIGSDTNTRAEFDSVLGNEMMTLSDEMMNVLTISSKEMQLSLANSAWIDEEFIVKDEWLGMIKSLMDAEAYQADLSAGQTMEAVNRWVEKNTNGMIDKMLEKPLSDATSLVLFNTLYFKAKWEDEFMASMTFDDGFTLADKSRKDVSMMHKYGFYADYFADDSVEGILLPYVGGEADARFAFAAIRTKDESEAIRDSYRRLEDGGINGLLDGRQSRLVDVKLPKFEITFDKILNQSLLNMGLRDAFDMEKADFSLIGSAESGGNLYIELVRQKAKIIIDEEGTEAAAVTEVETRCGGAVPESEEPIEIYFDRPFLYLIMDMEKEIPIFIGILDNPLS